MLKPLLKKTFAFIVFTIAVVVFATSCRPTKYVPKGKQLLRNNKIEVNGNEVKDKTASSIIKQKPNKKVGVPLTKIIIWRPYLMLYNWGKPEKEKGFGHWLTKIGEEPTVVDSNLTFSSARQIGMYYYNLGFFQNAMEFDIEYKKKDSSQANVIYKVYTGPQYYFNNVEYVISSPQIEQLVNEVSGKSKIVRGQPYNATILDNERNRLVSLLRNNGYYGFPKTLVRFEADTSVGDHNVNLKMIVSDKPVVIKDSLFYVEHRPYFIKDIYIDPVYSFAEGKSKSLDTTNYKGLTILQGEKKRFKSFYLESLIHFKQGDLYNEKDVKETYRHVTGGRVFQIADISFVPVEGDTSNRLVATANFQPYSKRTFTAELEGTTTAGNYGIAGVLTFVNRNIFKAGEVWDFSIRGGVEAQFNINSPDPFNTIEIGAELGVTFPRFLLAGRLNERVPKRMEPKSRVYTSYSLQNRIEFERNIFSIGLLYNWQESITKTHQINIIDANFVRLPRISQDYLNTLEFKSGFQDQLIMATRYTFVYDDKKIKRASGLHQFFRGSIEPAGNFLSAINGSGNFEQDTASGQYEILGVPFAQYIKVDFDFRNYSNQSSDHQIATRLFVGATFNYGNSPYLPPFEKSFFAGGSNDLRGWVAYRIGPGTFPKELYNQGDLYYASVAPFKIMANIEYRFPIIKSFKGAIFIDAGNIWLWDRPYDNADFGKTEQALVDNGIFKFDTFYKQLATNTGIGLRYDFGFFAFRLDLGMKIWDPSEPENYRYVLPGLRWNNITYNIALGYPF